MLDPPDDILFLYEEDHLEVSKERGSPRSVRGGHKAVNCQLHKHFYPYLPPKREDSRSVVLILGTYPPMADGSLEDGSF